MAICLLRSKCLRPKRPEWSIRKSLYGVLSSGVPAANPKLLAMGFATCTVQVSAIVTTPVPKSASAVAVTTESPIVFPETTHVLVSSIGSSVHAPVTVHCVGPSTGAGCPPGVRGDTLSRIFSSLLMLTSMGIRPPCFGNTGPTCQRRLGTPVPRMVNTSPGGTRMVSGVPISAPFLWRRQGLRRQFQRHPVLGRTALVDFMQEQHFSDGFCLLFAVRIGCLDGVHDPERILLERRQHLVMLAIQTPEVFTHGPIEEIAADTENREQ